MWCDYGTNIITTIEDALIESEPLNGPPMSILSPLVQLGSSNSKMAVRVFYRPV